MNAQAADFMPAERVSKNDTPVLNLSLFGNMVYNGLYTGQSSARH